MDHQQALVLILTHSVASATYELTGTQVLLLIALGAFGIRRYWRSLTERQRARADMASTWANRRNYRSHPTRRRWLGWWS